MKIIKEKKKKKSNCELCGIHKEIDPDFPPVPFLEPTGNGRLKVLIIGEALGFSEVNKGTQFIGQAGQVLRESLKSINIDLDEDCWKTNALCCRPVTKTKAGYFINRSPTNREISLCRDNVFKAIERYKPEKIILLGKSAVLSLLGHRTTKIGGISQWVGMAIPDQELKCWVYPNYHPSYVLRNEKDTILNDLFVQYLDNAFTHNVALPNYLNSESNVRIFNTVGDTCDFLEFLLLDKRAITFDYETTGLKPHAKGHEILCISVSDAPFYSYAFPFFENVRFRELWKQVLTNERIKKIAHNLKFENNWTKVLLGYDVQGWISDTMLNAHLIDNRSGITGLKIQTYLNFGIIGYDNEVHKYISSDEKGANNFNKLKEFPQKKLLMYCGLDSYFTYLLYEKQKRIIEQWSVKRKSALKLYFDALLAFCDIDTYGFTLKESYYENQDFHLKRKIKRLEKKILESPEARRWEEEEGEEFNYRSTRQMQKLLYDKLHHTVTKRTAKESPSTDKDVLTDIKTDFTNIILATKKLYKLKNTYLAGFLREKVGNKLYSVNNLHLVRSFRTSASNTNYQNISNREVEAAKLCRSGIIPSPGNQIVSFDYDAIEVRISACHHKDPEMIKYIKDPTTDLHRDMAETIFKLKEKQVTKTIRYYAKNCFVFPEFYGSYYAQCAPNLWKAVNTEMVTEQLSLRAHLAKRGIIEYNSFENHVREVEEDFWERKFRKYSQWKKRTWKDYQSKKYIESLTGLRFSGLMKKNDVLNYSIQSGACNCLLWSMAVIHDHLKGNNYKTRIIGQIHDELIFDMVPSEKDILIPIIVDVMCNKIKEHFKWIIVPLTVSGSATKIDGNWFEKEGIEL